MMDGENLGGHQAIYQLLANLNIQPLSSEHHCLITSSLYPLLVLINVSKIRVDIQELIYIFPIV